jgi:hypothetical protein
MYFGLSLNGKPFKKLLKFIDPVRRPTFYRYGLSYDLNNDGRIDFLYFGGSIVERIKAGFAAFQTTATDSFHVLQVRELPYEQANFYGNDLDGDGDIDYAFVPGGIQGYLTFFNDGAGQLNPAGLQRDTTLANLAETVEGGDFDGDGDIDLAFASSNIVSVMPERYAPDVSIFLNDGKGNFALASRVRLPTSRPLDYMLRAVDLDRDGDLDLIGIATGIFYVVASGSFATAVAQNPSSPTPMQFSIDPIYPNPVKGRARIELMLTGDSKEDVIVTIFDTTGRLVRSWHFDSRQQSIRFNWDIRDQSSMPVPSGVYFVQARLSKLSAMQKLLVLK